MHPFSNKRLVRLFDNKGGGCLPRLALLCIALQQQPQSSSQPLLLRLFPQPQLLLPQPQLLPPQPPQQQKRMISRMIHQEPLPPQPLFPQHILHFTSFHLRRDLFPRASVPYYGPGLSPVTGAGANIVRS